MLTSKKIRLHEVRKGANIIAAYDNFDFYEKVKYQVMGDNGKM